MNNRRPLSIVPLGLLLFAALGLGCPMCRGQCEKQWLDPAGDPMGPILTFTISDGRLIAGGLYKEDPGEDPFSGYIMQYDGSAWHTLGLTEQSTTINALTDFGGLVAGGYFTQVDGTPALNVARRENETWTALGAGLDDRVMDLIVYNGDLVACGYFHTSGGDDTGCVARWTGQKWEPFGNGLQGTAVAAIVYDGHLVVGGGFPFGDGIARWDGTKWNRINGGIEGTVFALTIYDGDLIAAGSFKTAGGIPAQNVAAWRDGEWRALGDGFGGVAASCAAFDGELYVGSKYYAGVARWNGVQWQDLPRYYELMAAYALQESEGALAVAGAFTEHGPQNWNLWGCPDCSADLDGNGSLDLFDFLAFVNAFNAADPAADCDHSQSLDLFDFLCFTNSFNAGC